MKVQRFLQPTLIEIMANTPVVIVEGARAVGKTWLLRELKESNHIAASFTLTEPTQLAAASQNPLAWLRSLPSPFAIDEAQLLPELPLALKALLDETDESIQCVLTGSAAIGQTGLGGTDPLARRVSRLTLEPLSDAELNATGPAPWSVIDQLFDGHPVVGLPALLPADWEEGVVRGGLPRYRVMNAGRPIAALHRQIAHDIKSLLTDDVLAGERNDSRIANDVLTHLLMHPGGELNVTAISRSVGIDMRTVNRYIDILERRFLVHEIPNFHRPSKKSSRSTAKCYPTDSALSGAALLTTDRTMNDASTRGGMMETHVVQQIKAHIGWAETNVSMTHWRENTNGRLSEVDLVLEDSRGRLVAIEIKAASAVTSGHFKGIRAFKSAYSEKFHRGFVISPGENVVAFDDDLWAIPLASLSHHDLWQESERLAPSFIQADVFPPAPEKEEVELPSVEEAKIFVSYSHQDQESSTGGDIRQFSADVVDALEGLHGRNVQLFLDVKDGNWGEDLWSRLDTELQASTFLMPFVTPRYLKSEGCRREFNSFSEATQRFGSEQLLLPLLWITPPAFRNDALSDPIVERMRITRYLDVTAARRADRRSADYNNEVEKVADQLEKVIAAREATTNDSTSTKAEPRTDGEPEPGLDDYLADAEELLPETQSAIEDFIHDLLNLGEEFKDVSVKFQSKTPTQLRATMVLVGNSLKKPNEQLMKSSRDATQKWEQLMTALNRGFTLISELGSSEVSQDLLGDLEKMATQLEDIDTAEFEGIAHQMPKMSSKLVPTSKALLSAVATLNSMRDSVNSWLGDVKVNK